jgi:hypothetical protein
MFMGKNETAAVVYPQVMGQMTPKVRNYINTLLKRRVQALMKLQGSGQPDVCVTGVTDTRVNAHNLLSVTTDIYAMRQHAAHGLTMRTAANLNLSNGKLYALRDLFKPDSDYIAVISSIIDQQIQEEQLPLITEFTGIKPHQPFYVTLDDLVICFATYEYTPYFVGMPEFPVPIEDLRELIDERSPLYPFLN